MFLQHTVFVALQPRVFLSNLIMIFLASAACLVSTPIFMFLQSSSGILDCYEDWGKNHNCKGYLRQLDSSKPETRIAKFGIFFTKCKSKDINLTTGPLHLLGWHIILYGVTRFSGLWLEAAVWFSYGVNPATSWPQLLWQRRPSEWKMVAETTFVNQMCFISSRPISLMHKETWPSEWGRAQQRKLVRRSPWDLILFRAVRRLTNWAQWDKL